MSDEQTPATPVTPTAPSAPAPTPEFDPSKIGSGESAQAAIEPRPKAVAEAPDAHGWWWGTGRRKTAVARVRIKPGGGKIEMQISRKKFKAVDDYFTEPQDRNDVLAPLEVTNTLKKFDVVVRAHGGGHMGQAQAVRLGIARALKKYDPQLEVVLREHGHLTRDARKVERKKYGLAGARRSFQFSKR